MKRAVCVMLVFILLISCVIPIAAAHQYENIFYCHKNNEQKITHRDSRVLFISADFGVKMVDLVFPV